MYPAAALEKGTVPNNCSITAYGLFRVVAANVCSMDGVTCMENVCAPCSSSFASQKVGKGRGFDKCRSQWMKWMDVHLSLLDTELLLLVIRMFTGLKLAHCLHMRDALSVVYLVS